MAEHGRLSLDISSHITSRNLQNVFQSSVNVLSTHFNSTTALRYHESNCSSRVGYSGPLSSISTKRRSNTRVKDDEDEKCSFEITVDVCDDSILVHNIKGGGDPVTALLASHLGLQPSSLGVQLPFRLRQVSQELMQITSTKGYNNQIDRTKSGAAWALQGLHFTTKNVEINQGWSEVEARLNEWALNGVFPKSLFSRCIGMPTDLAKEKCY